MDTQKHQSVGIQITVLSSGGCNILLFLHGWNFRTGLFYSFGLLPFWLFYASVYNSQVYSVSLLRKNLGTFFITDHQRFRTYAQILGGLMLG